MITESILTALAGVVTFVLDFLPDLPGFPDAVTDSMQYFVDTIVGVVGIISYLYTPVLTVFIFTALLVLFNFDNVYKTVLWFLHKVRG